MTKQELLSRLATHPEARRLSRKQIGALVDAVFREMAHYFVEARVSRRTSPRFTYPAFGTFTKKLRPAREGRNPRTGEPIAIPEQVTVAFQPGVELRSALNRTPKRRPVG